MEDIEYGESLVQVIAPSMKTASNHFSYTLLDWTTDIEDFGSDSIDGDEPKIIYYVSKPATVSTLE